MKEMLNMVGPKWLPNPHYNVKPTKVGKITFRSKLEASVWTQAIKIRKDIEYEPHLIEYVQHRRYLPDIVFKSSKGKSIYIEVKGRFTPEDRRKMLDVKESNPEMDIRFVFSSNGTLSAKKKHKGSATFSRWCERNGFPWAVGSIPRAWLTE